MATVPTVVVVRSIPVVLAVSTIVFFVVGDHVAEGKAVVRYDEVHTVVRFTVVHLYTLMWTTNRLQIDCQ